MGEQRVRNNKEPHCENVAADGLMFLDNRDIDATADHVWKLLVNVDEYDRLFSTCYRIKNLDPEKSLNPIEPGSRYLEKRKFKGERLSNRCTITSVNHEEPQRGFVLYTNCYGCSLTSTHVLESLDDSRCRLSISYGVAPNGWWGRLLLRCIRDQMVELGKLSLSMDLDDIKRVAEAVE